jgi:hypothetical protein
VLGAVLVQLVGRGDRTGELVKLLQDPLGELFCDVLYEFGRYRDCYRAVGGTAFWPVLKFIGALALASA